MEILISSVVKTLTTKILDINRISALPWIVNTTIALPFVIPNLKAEHFRCWMELEWLLKGSTNFTHHVKSLTKLGIYRTLQFVYTF